MAIKKINVGQLANDGTGDDLREAFIKVNDNFDELIVEISNAIDTEAENTGAGKQIFREKLGNTLRFKTLNQGANILITDATDSLTITGNAGVEEIVFLTDLGSIIAAGGTHLINVYGGQNISTSISNDFDRPTLLFSIDPENLIEQDENPTLGGNLSANNFNITNGNQFYAQEFLGNLKGLVYDVDVQLLNDAITGFDFGTLNLTIRSIIDYVSYTADIDFGPFTPQPGQEELLLLTLDQGTFNT